MNVTLNTTLNTSPSLFKRLTSVWCKLRQSKLFWFGVILCFALILFLMIPVILHWFMVTETPVHPADVIFIGVGLGNALDVVIDLQKSGMVKQIVVVYDEERLIEYEGKPAALHELTMMQLKSRGVPSENVQSVQWKSEDRIERQIHFRNWLLDHNISSYLAFVSTYHSRYSKMVHDATFPDNEVKQVMMVSGSNRVWRKQILNLHNTMIRMLYWYWITEPQLRMKIEQIR